MTGGDFDAYFDRFTFTATRLETLPAYAVGGAEQRRLEAFHAGEPRPLRNVVTDPWLARIALTSVGGKHWSRVRVVDEPLTDYQRYQLASYRESQAAGEEIAVARRADVGDVGPDFWLFDGGTSHAHALVMRYDEAGRWQGFEQVTQPASVADLVKTLHRVEAHAKPLNAFLAGQVAGV